MPPNSDVLDQAAALRSQVQAAVQSALTTFTHHLTLVIQTNPETSDARELLDRPDIHQALTDALADAHGAARAAVEQAAQLAGDQSSQYQLAIAHDVDSLYANAAAQIRGVAVTAFNSVPQPHPYTPGVDQLGSNPVFEAGQARARAVGAALTRQVSDIALRNGLSVNVAGSRSHTETVVEEALRRYQAGEDIWLEWRSQLVPGVTCPWCWALHGHRVRPGQEYPHPGQAGRRRPPRLYQGVLHGPPMHPNCRCWLVIVTSSGDPAPEAPEPPPAEFVTSTDIAAMPEEKYSGLLAFLKAALHELGQLLKKLVSG